MCTEKINNLSLLVAEKFVFPYFYISAFCSLNDRPTDKIFIEYMVIYERNVHRKNETSFLIRDRKSHLPLNVSNIRT